MSTSERYHNELGEYHEYTGGVFSTLEGYHDECACGGYGTMMSMGDIMSTPGMFNTLGFPYKFNCFPNDLPPHLS